METGVRPLCCMRCSCCKLRVGRCLGGLSFLSWRALVLRPQILAHRADPTPPPLQRRRRPFVCFSPPFVSFILANTPLSLSPSPPPPPPHRAVSSSDPAWPESLSMPIWIGHSWSRRCFPSVLRALRSSHVSSAISSTFPTFLQLCFHLFASPQLVPFPTCRNVTGKSLKRPPELHNYTGGRGKKQNPASAILEQDILEAWTREGSCSSRSNRTSRLDRDQEVERACWQLIGRLALAAAKPTEIKE